MTHHPGPRTPRRLAALFTALIPLLPACGAGSTSQPCTSCGAESGQLRVTNRAARACEALIEATDGRVVSIDFGQDIAGKSIQEGDRAGVSFISTSATPLPELAGTIHFNGSLKLLKATCYSEAGDALAGDGITL